MGGFRACSEERLVSSVCTWKLEELEAQVQSEGYDVTGAMGTLVGTGSLKGMSSKKIGRKVVLYGKAGLDCTELQCQTAAMWVEIRPRQEGSNFSGIIRRMCCKLPAVGLAFHQQLVEGFLWEMKPTLPPSKRSNLKNF